MVEARSPFCSRLLARAGACWAVLLLFIISKVAYTAATDTAGCESESVVTTQHFTMHYRPSVVNYSKHTYPHTSQSPIFLPSPFCSLQLCATPSFHPLSPAAVLPSFVDMILHFHLMSL